MGLRARHGARPSDRGLIDLALEFFGGLAGGLHRPVGIRADGKAALSTCRAIIEHESFGAAGRQAQREALSPRRPKVMSARAPAAALCAREPLLVDRSLDFPCQHCVNTSND